MSIARNSALVFANQLLAVAGGIVTSIITARYLGPSGRGILYVANTATGLAVLLSGFGLDYSLLYFVGKKRIAESQAFGFLITASLCTGSLAVLVGMALYPLLAHTALRSVGPYVFFAALMAVPAALLANFWVVLRHGLGDFARPARYQAFATAGAIGVVILVLPVLNLGVSALIVVSTMITWVLATAVVVVQFRRSGIQWRLPDGFLKGLSSYSLKVYAGSLMNYTYLRLDAFVLNAFTGTAAVGQYSMAVTLNEKLWLLDSAVTQATLPEVVSREHHDAKRLSALTSRTVIAISFTASAVLFVVAPYVITLLYGAAFLPSVAPLRVLLPGTVMYSGGRSLAQFFSGQLGRPGVTSTIAGVGAISSIVFYLILIPRFGAVGAAAGSTLSYALVFSILLIAFTRTTGVPIREIVLPQRGDWAVYRSIGSRVRTKLTDLRKSKPNGSV